LIIDHNGYVSPQNVLSLLHPAIILKTPHFLWAKGPFPKCRRYIHLTTTGII